MAVLADWLAVDQDEPDARGWQSWVFKRGTIGDSVGVKDRQIGKGIGTDNAAIDKAKISGRKKSHSLYRFLQGQ
jgi:hypothetical protein